MHDFDPIQTSCWYAVHTRSNHEKAVADAFPCRGIECLLPTYEAMSQWKDRRVLLTHPLFPGYLFVHITAAEKLKVLTVPGVVSVLCKRPVHDAIDGTLIELLRNGSAMRNAQPHNFYPWDTKSQSFGGHSRGCRANCYKSARPNGW